MDTYVRSLGVPTLNFLERWRDMNIPDNSKQLAILAQLEDIPSHQIEAVKNYNLSRRYIVESQIKQLYKIKYLA
jgi:hypothetical protein